MKLITNLVGRFILVLLCLIPAELPAAVTQLAIHRFDDLAKILQSINQSKQTLLVLDNDDTMTTMPCPDINDPTHCQFLGGDTWFNWQSNLAKDNTDRVAEDFDQLLQIESLLLRLSTMVYTEQQLPSLLEQFIAEGGHVLVATARDSQMLITTEMQFSQLKTSTGSLFDLIKQNNSNIFQMTPNMQQTLTYCAKQLSRAIQLKHNILYLAGQDKGKVLHCLLAQNQLAHDAIKHIVFIDDTKKNVVQVSQAFAHDNQVDVYAIQYLGLVPIKQAFTIGPLAQTYQANSVAKWRKLNDLLQATVAKPLI